jgi:chromosome segregation ATPase
VRCSPGGGDYTIICCTKGSQFSQQSSTNSTNWSRQLQNDCDVTELKEKLRNAEEEIRHLRLEKVSVKKKLNATKMELDSLIRSYDELQAEYNESGFLQV